MIDPYNVTKYDRTDAELQEYLLFCLTVAGKKATMMASKLNEFLSGSQDGQSPFEYIRMLVRLGLLGQRLLDVKMGKYGILEKAFSALAFADYSLSSVSIPELEKFPGVGQKTARYFVMQSRPDAKVAVIDTHVLKYLRARGHSVPDGYPPPKDYVRLEAIMISETEASGMTPADFDIAIWSHYASNGKHPLPAIPAFN